MCYLMRNTKPKCVLIMQTNEDIIKILKNLSILGRKINPEQIKKMLVQIEEIMLKLTQLDLAYGFDRRS